MSSNLTKYVDPNLVYLLMRAVRWLDAGMKADPALRDVPDLTNTQIMACAILSEGPVSISALARKLGISRQGAHQTVNVLKRAGFVDLSDDPGDQRSKIVELTAHGKEIDRQAVDAIWRLEDELRTVIGDARVEQLRESLSADWGAPPEGK